MYESPINIQMKDQMRTEIDGDIYKCVLSCGIDVDRDELIKALEYDRDSYSKGFKDGLSSAQKTSKWVIKSTFVNNDYVCQNCGAYLGDVSNAQNVTSFKFCFNCGARMEVD